LTLNKNIINGKGGKISISRDFAITTLAVVFFAITGWGLLKISQADRVYANKMDLEKIEHRMEIERCELKEELCRLEERINGRLERMEANLIDRIDLINGVDNE